ncbi:MAG: sigma-54-dependent Fis family transcriptional regulator [Sulfurifustis sp.]
MITAGSAHARLVHAAVEGGRNGLPVNSIITRSWERCLRDYRLDPSSESEPLILNGSDLAEREERLGPLLSFAQAEMANLYQQITGSGYAVMLTDASGVVVHFIGDPSFDDLARRSGLTVGGVWSEKQQGTNGMGTCLIEQKPVVVHHREHFYLHNAGLTCSAAPIFDPHGALLAVLDASGSSKLAQQHTMVLVNMAAQMLENRLLLHALSGEYVIRFHSRPEFVHTLGEGTVAFDTDGRVLAANRSALFQLGYESAKELLGRRIEEVFNVTVGALLQRAWTNGSHPLPIREFREGRRFFALVQQPDKTPARAARTAPVATEPAVRAPGSPLDDLDFGDPRMAENIRRAKRVLNKDIPILLFGETGSGKGRLARAIHEASDRRDKPFIVINCAAIPETLIESELFGYRPGAFTGASREGRRGKILQANGGTLFFDEIGDMPLGLQSRLLRLLEEKEVVPLGGEATLSVDVRVVSATHQDLPALMREGAFRRDLYYRLQGLVLSLPPLRERTDRRRLILRLARDESAGEPISFSDEALRWLENYAWPGNVRQLRGALRIMIALCDDRCVQLRDIPAELYNDSASPSVEPTPQTPHLSRPAESPLKEAEYEALVRVIEQNRWNISLAAKQLKVSRNTLYRKMKHYRIGRGVERYEG